MGEVQEIRHVDWRVETAIRILSEVLLIYYMGVSVSDQTRSVPVTK